MTIPVDAQGDIPEFHRLTGEAIRTWASIETTLAALVHMILGVDQFRARIVMGSIVGSRAKREFVARLGDTYLDDRALPKLRRLLKRLKNLSRTRNTLAHTPMHVNVDGKKNKIMGDAFTDEQGLDFDFRDFPINDLRVYVRALHELFGALTMFLSECGGHIFTEARIHREEAAAKRLPKKSG